MHFTIFTWHKQERVLTRLLNTALKIYCEYLKVINYSQKDKDAMLVFYDFPAEYWSHIRTTNIIESIFATVQLRTNKIKNCENRKTTLTMIFKLMETAQKKCNILNITGS